MSLAIFLSVGIGGFFGAIFRFVISSYLGKVLGSSFAYGTLGVNVLGSFIIGFLFLYFEQTVSPNLKAMLVTGMLGALTTFSTFSLESVLMLGQGLYFKAFLNILLNVVLSITFTIIGMMLFRKLYGV
jgi:CrcB protein